MSVEHSCIMSYLPIILGLVQLLYSCVEMSRIAHLINLFDGIVLSCIVLAGVRHSHLNWTTPCTVHFGLHQLDAVYHSLFALPAVCTWVSATYCMEVRIVFGQYCFFVSRWQQRMSFAFNHTDQQSEWFFCYICALPFCLCAPLQSSLKSSKKKKRTSFKRKSSKKGAEVRGWLFAQSIRVFLHLLVARHTR